MCCVRVCSVCLACFVCFVLCAAVFVRLFSTARQEADYHTCMIAVDGLAEPLKFFTPSVFFSELWPVILWAAASQKEVQQ